MAERLLILAGNPGAGKSKASRHLKEVHGFESFLVSDMIRAYAADRSISLDKRSNYLAVHRLMKDEWGDTFISDAVLARREESPVCVDGLRVPNDLHRLRQYGALVIALWCPIEIRYERATRRSHALSVHSFEDFRREEQAEYYSSDPEAQSTLFVMQHANFHVDATGSVEDTNRQIDDILATA